MFHICLLQPRTHPFLQVSDLGPRILWRSPTSVQGCEAYTEAGIVNILLVNIVCTRSRHGWQFEQLEEGLAGVSPALSILLRESDRVRYGLGKGHHRGFAIQWSDQFLGFWENDGCV